MEFRRRLRKLRLERDLTQEDTIASAAEIATLIELSGTVKVASPNVARFFRTSLTEFRAYLLVVGARRYSLSSDGARVFLGALGGPAATTGAKQRAIAADFRGKRASS